MIFSDGISFISEFFIFLYLIKYGEKRTNNKTAVKLTAKIGRTDEIISAVRFKITVFTITAENVIIKAKTK